MANREFCSDSNCLEGNGICEKHKQLVLDGWYKRIPKRYESAKLIDCNKQIVKEAESFLSDSSKQGFYVYGDIGCGKTHLKWSMIRHVLSATKINKQGQEPSVGERDCKELTFELHSCYTGKNPTDLVTYIKSITKSKPIIFFDDLGHGETTKAEFSVNMWNILMDEIYNNCTKVVFVSNYPVDMLSNYMGLYVADRIREICKGNVIEMSGKSKRQVSG
jgi:DNA replication protein DnaC